jgi:hypothetical protein
VSLRRALGVAAVGHGVLFALVSRVTPPDAALDTHANLFREDLEALELGPWLEREALEGARIETATLSPAASVDPTSGLAPKSALATANAPDESASGPKEDRATDDRLGDPTSEGAVGRGEALYPWERPSRADLGLRGGGAGQKNAFYKYQDDGRPGDARALSDRATRDLRQALLDRDKGLGLGPEGPVITALETAGYESPLPTNEAHAILDITIDGNGEVTSIGVDEVSSERGVWERFAKDALALVKGKRARVPAGSKGVALRIEMTSRVQLPSGHAPSTDVSVFGLTAKKGEGKDPVKVTILDPIPKLTTVPLDREGKIQLPMLTVELFGTNVDPTDLSLKVRRVVGAKVLSERLL